MGAAGYFLAINIAIAGLFAGAFGWLAGNDWSRPAARWFAGAYVLGAGYYGFEALVPLVPFPRLAVFAAFAAFLAALGAFTIGLARRYEVDTPWRLIALIMVVGLALNLAIQDMPRDSFWRVLLYQLPYAAMQALAASVVYRAATLKLLDRILFWVLVASAMHFLAKAWLAVMLGTGSSAGDYVGSAYALVSQSSGSVLIVAAGLLVMAILVRDLLASATEQSETDSLTGLLNRRGFERGAARATRKLDETGLPASIVICDLDHFKAINDTHGHASGDRVIVAFAETLREAADDKRFVAGRIGGEEFAVIVSGANAAATRLFAEKVRTAFTARAIDGLPGGMRVTASFGVAELVRGDTMSTMLRRADQALYQAKADGRDCVRLSGEIVSLVDERGRRQGKG